GGPYSALLVAVAGSGFVATVAKAAVATRGPPPYRTGVRSASGAELVAASGPGVGVDALGSDQYGESSLGGHHAVVFVPVVVRAAGGAEHVTEHLRDAAGVQPDEGIVGAGEVDGTVDGDPLPADAEHDRRPGPAPQVGVLAGAALHDEPDDGVAAHGVRQDAGVGDRCLRRTVAALGHHHREAVVAANEVTDVLDRCHGHELRASQPNARLATSWTGSSPPPTTTSATSRLAGACPGVRTRSRSGSRSTDARCTCCRAAASGPTGCKICGPSRRSRCGSATRPTTRRRGSSRAATNRSGAAGSSSRSTSRATAEVSNAGGGSRS